MFIQEDKISEIRSAADILEVVSDGVQLKKTGQNYMGLCPFHSEKTPSFSVNPQREIYHCFGCGAGGDVFAFVMKRDGLSFPESVRFLAGRYGVEIPEREMTPREREILSERENLFKTNDIALKYFHNMLLSGKQGHVAREYLKKRGMNSEIAKTFMLGFVPDGWDNLSKHLANSKVPGAFAEKTGLVVSKNQGRYYDRFRNRVIFPIIDINNHVTGFGGRVLDDSLPKYLNSPETMIYNKSKSLYGYNCTRQICRETETVHIVEGYFDLITLYAFGVENVVATLGTAITRDHIRMLSRGGVKKFVLVFDSDTAGLKAAERSIPIFQKEFINANILVLPEGHDPDSFIRAFGKEKFLEASINSMGVIQFLTESAIKRNGLTTEGRINIIEELKGSLAMVDDSLACSLYIRDIAARIGVDERAVLERVKEDIAGRKYNGSGNGRNVVSVDFKNNKRPVKKSGRWSGMEHQILSMMLQFPEILEECRQQQVADYFEDEELKMIGGLVLEYAGEAEDMVSDLMLRASTNGQRELIASLAIGEIPWLYNKCVDLITQFVENKTRYEDSLSDRIRIAEENNDQELLIQLIQEKNLYSKQLKEKLAQARKRY